MSGTAGAFAPRLRLAISFAGLRLMLQEMRAKGIVPMAIMVSPFESKDLKRELTDTAVGYFQDDADQAWSEVDDTIGFIEGIPILNHPDIERGKCYLVPKYELTKTPDQWIAVM